jgi:DNA-binding transcriptional LysR family regulator
VVNLPTADLLPTTQGEARLKSRQLALVVALDDTRSLRQAAERIHISQPAATRLLQELESQLGVELFQRSRRGMQPTMAGEVMVRHARTLLTGMKEAYADTRATAMGGKGHLRLGIFGSANPQGLAQCIIQIKQNYPSLEVMITEAPLEMLLTALRDGELDLIVNRTSAAQVDDVFRQELLYIESFVLTVGADNSLARKRKVNPSDLRNKIWLVPPTNTLLRHQVDTFFAMDFGGTPAHLVQTTSLLASLAMLRLSDAVAVMAKHTADFFSARGFLKTLPFPLATLSRPVSLINLRDPPVKPQLQYLTHLLRQQAVSARSSHP